VIPFDSEQRRLIVPRWRSFRDTAIIGELSSRGLRRPIPLSEEDFTEKLQDWQEDGSIITAVTLLEAAMVSGRADEARQAADFVLQPEGTATNAVRLLATAVQNGLPNRNFEPTLEPRSGIATIRSRLATDPRDALLWTDAARLYSSVGQNDQAKRAAQIALSLADSSTGTVRR
jgi:predicted Zn-dependent protease